MSPTARALALPGLFVVLALAVLVGLGSWQLDRKTWKEALIAQLNQRLSAAPVDLPAPDGWPLLSAPNHEFRRVAFPAQIVPLPAERQEARVYTAGSALRADIKTPGYFAFSPMRLAGGSVVVVNRGYVPNPKPDKATAPLNVPSGLVDLVGVLRWPEPRGMFVSEHNATDDLWTLRDQRRMAETEGWGSVAPFYVDLEEPEPKGGLPKPGKLAAHLTNNHLQYALTWFSLALVLVAVFAVWAWRRVRGGALGQA